MRKIDTKEILSILPQSVKSVLQGALEKEGLQEIRIRSNKPLVIQVGRKEIVYGYVPNEEDLKAIVQRISNYSIYAFEEEIKKGYITIKGGHRIGICGRCVIEGEEVKTIKNIASLNIRICREIIGCSDSIMKFILKDNNLINTIIISPPQCGKTTLLRDITRNISDGMSKYDFKGKKVCVVDERSEIAACYNGISQLKIGIRTDVLDSCLKCQGIMMAVRSMSPDVIVCDEIGTHKDIESILFALNSGVSLITTIHGYGIEDLYNRNVFREVMENNVFKRAIVLSCKNGVGTVEYVYDFISKSVVWEG